MWHCGDAGSWWDEGVVVLCTGGTEGCWNGGGYAWLHAWDWRVEA